MISRRWFLYLSAASFASCSRARSEYFGNTKPPSSAKLVHSLPAEPATLDPAKSGEDIESYVVPALFEGLTLYHPLRPEPMAGLATHYEASPDLDSFTFYLRGHSAPRGVRLPNTDTLPVEFTRGQKASSEAGPAYWSDGSRVTAHDVVYSWRRLIDPETAAPMAYQLYYIENAEAINKGKRTPSDLGVKAIDDFTLQVDLRSPTPFFLQLITQFPLAAVPRQAVEAARQRGNESSWTEPEHIIVSGPFTLKERRRYDLVRLIKNWRYYDAHLVSIEELSFPIVVDGTTTMNLYRSGGLATMPGPGLSPLFTPILGALRDFHVEPAYASIFPVMNVRKPPFDNLLVRYALNMGTEKKQITDFLGASRVPALTLVPSTPGYGAPNRLFVDIDGNKYDVLSFNLEAARSLLGKAGLQRTTVNGHHVIQTTYHYPVLPDTKLKGEIFQQQWLRNLGMQVNLAAHEFSVHWQMIRDGDYAGVADYAFFAPYFDPNPFLEQFSTVGPGNPSGWTDPGYAAMLAEANCTLDPRARMRRLVDCEERLLRAMPFIPLYVDVWAYLQKPFVRGLRGNRLADMRSFKYAWIDTKWRPETDRAQVSRR